MKREVIHKVCGENQVNDQCQSAKSQIITKYIQN